MVLDFNIPSLFDYFSLSFVPTLTRMDQESCSVINVSVSMTLPQEINHPEARTDDKLICRYCRDLLHEFRQSIRR